MTTPARGAPLRSAGGFAPRPSLSSYTTPGDTTRSGDAPLGERTMTATHARRFAGSSAGIFCLANTYLPGRQRDATHWILGARLHPTTTFLVFSVSPTLTVTEMVAALRDGGLPISAIAEMARVERKTVYSWLDGAEVREENTFRVSELHRMLNHDKLADFRSLYRLWARPLEGDATLRSLLSAESLDETTIRQALNRLWPIARKHAGNTRHLASSGTMSDNPLLSEIPDAGPLSDR
jgi:hypothetical protein